MTDRARGLASLGMLLLMIGALPRLSAAESGWIHEDGSVAARAEVGSDENVSEALRSEPNRGNPLRERYWSRLLPLEPKTGGPELDSDVYGMAPPMSRLRVKLGADGRFRPEEAYSLTSSELVQASPVPAASRPVASAASLEELPGVIAAPADASAEPLTPAAPTTDVPPMPAEQASAPVPAPHPATGDDAGSGVSFDVRNVPALPHYRIRTGDSLEISVPYEAGTDRTVPVRPDGRISYLFGIELVAAGKTYAELQQDLLRELEKYYRYPRVTVIGRSFAGNAVYVLGPVSRPGAITIQSDTRLLDVLSQAGVLSLVPESSRPIENNRQRPYDLVDLKKSYVVRNQRVLPISIYDMLVNRRINENNILMRPGDYVFIASAYGNEKRIVVGGRVSSPQVFYYSDDLTLLEALMEAGGTDVQGDAWMRNVYVVRNGLEEPLIFDVGKIIMGQAPDFVLQDRDLVYVPERPLAYGSRVTTSVIREILAPLRAVLDMHETAKEYYQRDWSLGAPLDE